MGNTHTSEQTAGVDSLRFFLTLNKDYFDAYSLNAGWCEPTTDEAKSAKVTVMKSYNALGPFQLPSDMDYSEWNGFFAVYPQDRTFRTGQGSTPPADWKEAVTDTFVIDGFLTALAGVSGHEQVIIDPSMVPDWPGLSEYHARARESYVRVVGAWHDALAFPCPVRLIQNLIEVLSREDFVEAGDWPEMFTRPSLTEVVDLDRLQAEFNTEKRRMVDGQQASSAAGTDMLIAKSWLSSLGIIRRAMAQQNTTQISDILSLWGVTLDPGQVRTGSTSVPSDNTQVLN